MSVSVRKLVKDKMVFNHSPTKPNSAIITTISVTARIDYILRFSKQSVLVIDDNAAVYSKVAGQFLNTLTNKNNTHINAAFVCASPQLNDIQMRCRLIEQLFSDTLFDPEQSLVVSILRLIKQQPQAITIVIEHAQSLSLQLKYELSQLAEVAKKTANIINVVMFGSIESAQQVASEKSIFGSNLAIILANTGQVISINHKMLKNKNSLLSKRIIKILSWGITTTVFLSLLVWMAVNNGDYLKLKADEFISLYTKEKVIIKESIEKREEPNALPIKDKTIIVTEKLASTQDINQALLTGETVKPITVVQKKLAESNDILKALSLSEKLSENKKIVSKKIDSSKDITLPKKLVLPTLPLDANYYLAKQQGYIIQIAGFSDEFIFTKFLEEYPKVELYSYQRLLNKEPFMVLTSKIYTSKNNALKAINTLPKALQERGLWVKSIEIVNKEINSLTNR